MIVNGKHHIVLKKNVYIWKKNFVQELWITNNVIGMVLIVKVILNVKIILRILKKQIQLN